MAALHAAGHASGSASPKTPPDDDNPDISDYIGRAELAAAWNVNADNTLGADGAPLAGSQRADGLGAAGVAQDRGQPGCLALGNLRFHTQLFNGYGDSLLDYNRRRTVFSVGLSLVDW